VLATSRCRAYTKLNDAATATGLKSLLVTWIIFPDCHARADGWIVPGINVRKAVLLRRLKHVFVNSRRDGVDRQKTMAGCRRRRRPRRQCMNYLTRTPPRRSFQVSGISYMPQAIQSLARWGAR